MNHLHRMAVVPSAACLLLAGCVGDSAPEESTAPSAAAPTSSEAPTEAGPPDPVAEEGSVRAVIAERPDLSEADRVIEAWLSESDGRIGVLRNARGVTVFLPDDDGFDDALVEQLVDDPSLVSAFLGDHLVVGTVRAEDLDDEVVAASGASHDVGEGPSVGGRRIVEADVAATNGIVHVLDGSLTTPGEPVDPDEG